MQVLVEATFLRRLYRAGCRGVPKVLWVGTFLLQKDRTVIESRTLSPGESRLLRSRSGVKGDNFAHGFAMPLLGKSLDELRKDRPGRRLSTKTVLQLADQGLTLLEQIHTAGVIHRDLKPANLLMGRGSTAPMLHLVDYGLSKWYVDKDGRHRDEATQRKWGALGTALFSSLRQDRSKPQSRRDDVESFGLVLLMLIRGQLPWQSCDSSSRRIRIKREWSGLDLCCFRTREEHKAKKAMLNIPPSLGMIVDKARALEFSDVPPYDELRRALHADRKKKGFEFDGMYDWS